MVGAAPQMAAQWMSDHKGMFCLPLFLIGEDESIRVVQGRRVLGDRGDPHLSILARRQFRVCPGKQEVFLVFI